MADTGNPAGLSEAPPPSLPTEQGRTAMTEFFDVVIAGGAAMGSSVAYHLMADPAFTGRVLVVEKDPTYGRSASALSAASIRQQFSTAVNIRISLHGIRFLREIGETLAVDGERPEIGLKEGGYLYLASEAGAPILARNQALQVGEGADIEPLDTSALSRRFPWLRTDDLARGAFGRSGEGWFDGWGLLQALRRKARSLRAEFRTGRVAEVQVEGGRIAGLRLAGGERIACEALVNCAGSGGRWRRLPGSTSRFCRSAATCSPSPAGSRCRAARFSSTPQGSMSVPRATASSAAPHPGPARTTPIGRTTIRRPRR